MAKGLTTKERRAVAVCAAWGGPADRVIARNGGEYFEARRFFFYTHGATAEGFATKLEEFVPGLTVRRTGRSYHDWPKDSFFYVKFTCDIAECVERATTRAACLGMTIDEAYREWCEANS